METMVLGLLALTFLLISICCLCHKKPVWGMICSVAAMVLTCLTGYSWKELLIGSGKDTTLLGLHRYPAAPMILAILLLAALLLMIVGIIGVARQNKS
ncbi:MAG: hypothetical protein IJN46_01905 [Lachnospiraceae bacterium]|nr:hypothetical protein [Lachnospiraceae bacterium]